MLTDFSVGFGTNPYLFVGTDKSVGSHKKPTGKGTDLSVGTNPYGFSKGMDNPYIFCGYLWIFRTFFVGTDLGMDNCRIRSDLSKGTHATFLKLRSHRKKSRVGNFNTGRRTHKWQAYFILCT